MRNWNITFSRHKLVVISTLGCRGRATDSIGGPSNESSCCLRQVSIIILGYKIGLHLGFIVISFLRQFIRKKSFSL